MVILGISCYFHDAAAAIIKDGALVAAAQEERFTRKKHDPNFPLHAANFCLEAANVEEGDIDYVAFYENPSLALDRIAFEIKRQPAAIAVQQFKKMLTRWPSTKLDIEGSIRRHLPGFKGRVLLVDHHHSHAAAAFYPSPFEDAAILTVDGVGEWATAAIAHGHDGSINCLREMHYPHSVGLLYSAATHFLGFKVNSGEYKVMGLSAYGSPIFAQVIKKQIVTIMEDGSIALNPSFFDLSGVAGISTAQWPELFGQPRRIPESPLDQFHADVAASFQHVTEDVVTKMARHAQSLTGAKNLCLGGGVSLNCVANRQIIDTYCFENIWIQPAAGDAGSCVGAALAVWHELLKGARIPTTPDGMKGALLGPGYDEDEIRDFLDFYDFPYHQLERDSLGPQIATMLVSGKVIGLLQDRMEFGPRALGARSIIADPRSTEMQLLINKSIKFRESFRPFAPVVLEEAAHDWFDISTPSPYMLLTAPIRTDKRLESEQPGGNKLIDRLLEDRSTINAVTHVDYSARVQTLSDKAATPLRDILSSFFEQTGTPVLVNTSFNLRGEPIVCAPMDAYRCMMRSRIDGVLMGNVLVLRDEQPPWEDDGDWKHDLKD